MASQDALLKGIDQVNVGFRMVYNGGRHLPLHARGRSSLRESGQA